jgi:transcriptional regulator with XRE-family HTH domain
MQGRVCDISREAGFDLSARPVSWQPEVELYRKRRESRSLLVSIHGVAHARLGHLDSDSGVYRELLAQIMATTFAELLEDIYAREKFGRIIRRCRSRAGLSQDELAKSIYRGGKATISFFETGRRLPDEQSAAQIYDALQVSTDERIELERLREKARQESLVPQVWEFSRGYLEEIGAKALTDGIAEGLDDWIIWTLGSLLALPNLVRLLDESELILHDTYQDILALLVARNPLVTLPLLVYPLTFVEQEERMSVSIRGVLRRAALRNPEGVLRGLELMAASPLAQRGFIHWSLIEQLQAEIQPTESS